MGEFVAERGGDFGRPEELVFEVDEPLRGSKGAEVGLEDAELAARTRAVDPLGDGADDLKVDLSGLLGRCDRVERLAGDFVPAHLEVFGDVGDGGAEDSGAGVVPAHLGAGRVLVGVVAVAGFRGEIDTADKGDAVVDHDRLLVVAVQRSFLGVQGALDLRLLS